MRILEFFSEKQSERWIKEIESCDWSAAKRLAELLKENHSEKTFGDDGKLFILADGENLVSFITLTQQDCIADKTLSPWLGFLFTKPQYRGRGYAEKMIGHACSVAKKEGHKCVYLATDHVGLYERFGFTYKENRLDYRGEDSRIYTKEL